MSITKPNHRSGETIGGTWRLDPQRSSIGFRVGHFWGMVTVNATSTTTTASSTCAATPQSS